ncbi:putative proton-coupled amino acid transporter [Trypoxylus dichotomus]
MGSINKMKEKAGPTELDTFLPGDSANKGTKYEISSKIDVEAVKALNGEYDPFKTRILDHPVSDCDTLTHLLKASLGTGILAMPAAFNGAGLVLGIFATILVAIICTHCSYILVVCAHELYRKTQRNQMSFADVAEEACKRGPKWSRKYGPWARQLVLIGLFVTYFATCSCYTVIIAKNFSQVIDYYLGYHINFRIYIASLLIPTIILAYVPNLKSLAPVSMLANAFMGLGLGITVYYLVIDLPPISTRNLVAPISTLPVCVSITIFAIEAIGVVMPLENNMKTPQHFTGLCGVLNQGMAGVTLIYILIGFLGYFKYGNAVEGSITLNLPHEDYLAQAVKILIGLAVFFTFGLQFYVCLEIVWNGIKHRYVKNATFANYILRTVMVIICVLLAVALPMITPFVGLIGAFCFSILGLIVPVVIEIITFWDKGFGKYNWKIVKNAVVIIAGIIALIFGSKMAIEEIIQEMSQTPQNATIPVNNGSRILEATTDVLIDTINATIASITTRSPNSTT